MNNVFFQLNWMMRCTALKWYIVATLSVLTIQILWFYSIGPLWIRMQSILQENNILNHVQNAYPEKKPLTIKKMMYTEDIREIFSKEYAHHHIVIKSIKLEHQLHDVKISFLSNYLELMNILNKISFAYRKVQCNEIQIAKDENFLIQVDMSCSLD